MAPRRRRWTILYEDEALLAVDKPAGIACHPMGKTQSGTVIQFARQREELQIRARLEKGDTELVPPAGQPS